MAPERTASSGVFLSKRFVEHGVASLVRGGSSAGIGTSGIDFQDWLCTFDAANIYVTPQVSGTGLTLAMLNVTQATVAMDRSNQPNIAYIALGTCKLRWWDATINSFVTTVFAGATRILVVQDDPRDPMSSSSDVVVTYQGADTGIYFRRQRDRYSIEYISTAAPFGYLMQSFGMAVDNRLRWRCV